MSGQVSSIPKAIYDILIRDADGRHLELESFENLENARRRFPLIAERYPETKITLWNRFTRTIIAEPDGYEPGLCSFPKESKLAEVSVVLSFFAWVRR